MKNIAIVDIIKKLIIFICILIALILLIVFFSAMFGLYSPIDMNIGEFFVTILMFLLIAVIAKYTGEIVIVVLKSKRE